MNCSFSQLEATREGRGAYMCVSTWLYFALINALEFLVKFEILVLGTSFISLNICWLPSTFLVLTVEIAFWEVWCSTDSVAEIGQLAHVFKITLCVLLLSSIPEVAWTGARWQSCAWGVGLLRYEPITVWEVITPKKLYSLITAMTAPKSTRGLYYECSWVNKGSVVWVSFRVRDKPCFGTMPTGKG